LADVFSREVRTAIPDAELWMVSDRCEVVDGIRWIQAPSDAELRELLSKSWVFCLPSTYEGFGIPYLEAMAHGVPVVATPNYGAQALLTGGCGAVVADDELGSRLVKLLGDSPTRETLSAAGLARAQEYGWDEIISRHERAYADAIARWGSGNAPGSRRPSGRAISQTED
jgi:glycosyltransferase involved in cell wall biosynthesis